MKKLIAALTIALAFVFTAPAMAAPKADKNSQEHKAWVENFRKKHDVKGKPAKKQPAKKAADKKKKK